MPLPILLLDGDRRKDYCMRHHRIALKFRAEKRYRDPMRFAIGLLFTSLLTATIGFATVQNQKFGIATYKAPSGWKEEKGGGHISYTKTVGSNFAQIALYDYVKSKGDIQVDFDAQWKELIANGKEISAPDKGKPVTANGWTAMSGSGTWKFNDATVATILTVYSNQKACVSVLVNFTDPDLARDYVAMLESLSLDASKAKLPITATNENGPKKPGLVGLWIDYFNETRGYSNGYPLLTAGYFRREYNLKADGTYIYRAKDWSVNLTDILFIYETGTWKADATNITFTPKAGTSGWWGKAPGGSTTGWGKFKKGSTHSLQPITYAYDMRYFEGVQKHYMILEYKQGTSRDRGVSGDGKNHQWNYSPRELDKSLIDNPPGFKVPVAGK